MKSPGLGKEEPPAMIQAGNCLPGGSSAGKALGAVVGSELTTGQQHAIAVKKTNNILGCINRSTASAWSKVIIPLYSALLRSQLIDCVWFWAPQYGKDLAKVEPLQQWATSLCEES